MTVRTGCEAGASGTGGERIQRVHELISSHPPDSVALVDHNTATVSYGVLNATAERLAIALHAHGVRAGDRVVLLAENCAVFVAVLFALSRLDAWAVPVNARQSALEVDSTVAHAGARCLVFTCHVSQPAAEHAERLGATLLCEMPLGPLFVSDVLEVTPEPTVSGDAQIAALMYTTGTTSAPKGVMLSHRNVIANTRAVTEVWQATARDRVLCTLPMTHIFGFASVLLPSLFAGGTVVLLPRFSPVAVTQVLADGVSVFPAVPQMMAALLAYLDEQSQPLVAPAIRRISCGGAPLDPDLKRRVESRFGIPLGNGYGITEAAPTVASSRLDKPRADNAVGWPVTGMSLRIVSPDSDGIGEIWLRGDQIMRGYYRNPEGTRAALTDDGWLRTGDLGWVAEDGAVFIVGRLKELIIRSGFNVYPPEIEAMLTRHPAVHQAAVVGRAVQGDEEIVAFVLTDGSLDGATLQAWARERLVAYKVPQRVYAVPEFPTAATGKVLKHTLLKHFAAKLESDC